MGNTSPSDYNLHVLADAAVEELETTMKEQEPENGFNDTDQTTNILPNVHEPLVEEEDEERTFGSDEGLPIKKRRLRLSNDESNEKSDIKDLGSVKMVEDEERMSGSDEPLPIKKRRLCLSNDEPDERREIEELGSVKMGEKMCQRKESGSHDEPRIGFPFAISVPKKKRTPWKPRNEVNIRNSTSKPSIDESAFPKAFDLNVNPPINQPQISNEVGDIRSDPLIDVPRTPEVFDLNANPPMDKPLIPDEVVDIRANPPMEEPVVPEMVELNANPQPQMRHFDLNISLLEPELPWLFTRKIEEMGGYEVKLVIEKRLFKTDLSTTHARFSIPENQIRREAMDFVREEEVQLLEQHVADKKLAGMPVLVLDPCVREITLILKKWKMTRCSVYNLVHQWNTIVRRNQLTPNDKVQLWSFRNRDDKLCFALIRL